MDRLTEEKVSKYSWYRSFKPPILPEGQHLWPKITIVTPSFNQGDYIEETILSVISQQYPNLEYFIVDGGSLDTTVDIIKKYDNFIDWWVCEKDSGQTDAINKGFKRATGQIVNWINSDDILYPGALFEIATAFLNNPRAGFVYGKTERFNASGSMGYMQHPEDDLPLRYFYGFPYGQQGCFYKRELVENLGYLNSCLRFSMDYDLFVRLHMVTDPIRIDALIGGFRDHVMSKTNNMESVMVGENMVIFKTLLETYGFDRGVKTLTNCGAGTLPLKGYPNQNIREFNESDLEYITMKFLSRYVFYFYDIRNYKYVCGALEFISKHNRKLYLEKPVFRKMYRKARLMEFFS